MSKQSTSPVWYEPHPVTVERKALIRSLGFVIIDAIFQPEGEANPDVPELSPVPLDANGLRLDGPTVEIFVAAGYKAEHYPPSGYASLSSDDEIAAAVAAQIKKDHEADGKLSIAEIRAALTAMQVDFDPKAKKADLQALLDASSTPA